MNFDRVANVYDATRGFPEEVGERIAEGVASAIHATSETRFLEIGVGTGRIAIPMARRGYPYTGVDISAEMMARVGEKANLPNLSLLQSDVTALPFRDFSFDAVLGVHVLHLVPEWRLALAEARRVTVPGGYILFGQNYEAEDDPENTIRGRWRELAADRGARLERRGGSLEDVQEELTAQGCLLSVYRLVRWRQDFAPIDLIDQIHRRTFSAGFDLSDEIMDGAHEPLLAWARETFGDLEKPVQSESEFVLTVGRWPA